jgi:nicotinamidase-related amidase/alkylated DNA repair dioxygenase AlkB
MSSSLLALLSQQAPVQTRRGLILTGLQNDFLSPDGKLPVITSTGFLDRLTELVKEFREHGDIIWVRSHFKENRNVNLNDDAGDTVVVDSPRQTAAPALQPATPVRDGSSRSEASDDDHPPSPPKKARFSSELSESKLEDEERTTTPEDDSSEIDEELFLTRTASREPCCIPNSFGAEYATQIKDMVDERRDLQLIKTFYSAFQSTNLLTTLRAKLVTELYICGCTTNLSVFATAMDAARHGISITLIDDCLGYRRKGRHDLAIKRLREIMGARVMTSAEVIDRLNNPLLTSEDEDSESEGDNDSDVDVREGVSDVPVSSLVVDSDEEGDDLVASNVRVTDVNGRTLAMRDALALESSLRRATAAESELEPALEPREPPSARAADAGSCAGVGVRDNAGSDHSSGYGKEENHFDGWIGRATTSRSSSLDGEQHDSSKGVTLRSHWSAIDQEMAKHQTDLIIRAAHRKHSGLSAMSAPNELDCKDPNGDVTVKSTTEANNQHKNNSTTSKPLFGADKQTESAGSRILYDLLPEELASNIFDKLNSEITWQKMHHQTGEVPRLVCCQGTIDEDGSMPVYRHPSDQSLPIQGWTPVVDRIRREAEEAVGHPLIHALIQLYRSGNDFISEHSDKTLDIARDSCIVNVSFGAQRTMRLRTKRTATRSTDTNSPGRITYRVPMPHNSMIIMSLPTNAEYLHGINADKRPSVELSDAEKAFSGQRISLTFRNIGTFLNADSSRIWGQGATAKTKADAKPVINADAVESENLVRAFGMENQATSIEWERIYGDGSDVLHLK